MNCRPPLPVLRWIPGAPGRGAPWPGGGIHGRIDEALSSLALYGLFVATQTVRHRDYFLPVSRQGAVIAKDHHADAPTARTALISLRLWASP